MERSIIHTNDIITNPDDEFTHSIYRLISMIALDTLIANGISVQRPEHIQLFDTVDNDNIKVDVVVSFSDIDLNNETEILSKNINDSLGLYYSLKSKILSDMNARFTPRINPDDLSSVGLSEEQFIITINDITLTEVFDTLHEEDVNDERIDVLVGVIRIDFLMSIEDISVYEPDERAALYARLHFICNSSDPAAHNELLNWIDRLGIDLLFGGLEDKDELCEIIRSHYGF